MKWIEVKIVTNREYADIVSLLLIEQGSEGTVIKDSADLSDLLSSGIIWDYVDEHLLANTDERVFVSGFFELEASVEKIYDSISSLGETSLGEAGALEISVSKIDSLDWENEWKKYYMPIEYSTFAIVPQWIKNHGMNDKRIVVLNPGMAFGTGTHETTSMCLQLMDEICFIDQTILDLGCGSGILGITAAVLGAKKVVLTDIDEVAVKCTKENVLLNSFQSEMQVLCANLFEESIDTKADILLANLTAPLLLMAKDGIKNHLKKGGTLIISGILSPYNDEVLSSYLSSFDIVKTVTKGEWLAHKLLLR